MRILLLDLTTDWDVPQQQALSLARALKTTGRYEPLICCPVDSPLALRALVEELPLLELGSMRPRHPLTLWRFWTLLRRERHLLIQTFEGGAPLLGYMARCMRSKGATILIHSRFVRGSVREPLTGRTWREMDKILAGNAQISRQLHNDGLASLRVNIVHPGLEAASYPPRRPRRDGRFAFVMAGPLGGDAGHSVLLQAMAALWQRGDLPPWEVRMLGDGPLFGKILHEAEALGVEARLALLGAQPEADVLGQCDALVAPSAALWGDPRALAVGWLSELPVICSSVPVHRELARPEDAVLFVPPDAPQDLAAAMIRLMREPELCARLSLRGVAMRDGVSDTAMTEQCLALYAQCIASRGWVLPSPAAPKPDGETPPPPKTPSEDAP